MESRARALWLGTEPPHAVLYFDERCRGMGEDLGLGGFWTAYFAARVAPLGAVTAGAATATLAVFAPDTVARALPSAWAHRTPAELTEARARYAATALRRVAPSVEARAAALAAPLTAMVEDAPALGRPLFAANRPLCRRADPVEQLWQLTTAVREFRGDAHAAALADHGLDAPEALVLTAATGRVPATARSDRGWSETEWLAATERLRSRGLLDAEERPTASGAEVRTAVEEATDRLSARLLRPLTEERRETLLATLAALAGEVVEAGVLPFPNPMGLPHPT